MTAPDQIEGLEIVEHDKGVEARMWLRPDRRAALAARRRFMAGPVGCGLCGIDSLEAAARDVPHLADGGLRLTRDEVAGATDALRAHQPLHDLTRAVHAAGFFRPGEGIVLAREDVGRHNALDKLLGALAAAGIDPATGAVVMTSRVSVELVQKCAVAGVSRPRPAAGSSTFTPIPTAFPTRPPMSPDKMVYMANQIATFFRSQPGSDPAEKVAAHLRDYWDPSMRSQRFSIEFRAIVLLGAGQHPRMTRLDAPACRFFASF